MPRRAATVSQADVARWPSQFEREIISALPDTDDLGSFRKQWDMADCGGDFEGERPKNVIYFLRGELSRLIRIGTTHRLNGRLANHQSSSAELLTLLGVMPGGVPLERRFHNAFAAIRHHGGWYYPHPVLRQTIARVKVL